MGSCSALAFAAAAATTLHHFYQQWLQQSTTWQLSSNCFGKQLQH
jgi:hypothetical protein